MADRDTRPRAGGDDTWPPLPFEEWRDTCETLQRWAQIVGKIRLAQSPMENHWWQVPLYVTARGLTTSSMPFGSEAFQIDFDFVDHRLVIATSRGTERSLPLAARPVADFYREVMDALRALDLDVRVWTTPVEVADLTPFEDDRAHASYDADAARRFWRILLQSDRVLKAFRGGFLGKSSPVHFFWGSFDLALTRFSGRAAPPFTGAAPNVGAHVMHEAYSHELSSAGWWPGDARLPYPAFYAYAVPTPAGYAGVAVRPAGAFFHRDLGEFILPYEEFRTAARPDELLMEFLQSTYEAAATLGGWDRRALEERTPCACDQPTDQAPIGAAAT